MNDDPMEGPSELFATLLGDVSQEQWENYKEQSKQSGLICNYDDSDDDSFLTDSRSISPCDEELITNVEVVEKEDSHSGSEGSENEDEDQTSWGCDAAIKYVNGEISFSELTDIMENTKVCRPKKRRRLEKIESRAETQLEKEDREYQMEVKKKRKERRRINRLPKHLEGLMGAANLSFAKGNTEEALKTCMELIRLAPTAQEPFQTLGVIYDDMGESQKSFQCCLVAAYLNPTDTEEWIRLAELSIEQSQIQQAISCYSRAIKNEPQNVNYLWERCNLYEQIGDRKKALTGYELILKQLSNPEDGIKCVEISREIAKVHHDNNDCVNAIKVLETAFSKFPSLITSEDVNFLLELQLNQKCYNAAMKNFVQHCGVELYVQDKVLSSVKELENFTDEDFSSVTKCFVPDVLPIDLAVKILICLIHLRSVTAMQPLLDSLKQESPENIGDLYLDVAEAFMETNQYEWSKPLLIKLLSSKIYNLPAVWMKYGDCLRALSDTEEAMNAYQKVIDKAPSYQEARMSLAKILLQLGKVQDAIHTLRQEYEDGKVGATVDTEVLFERCKLLEAEGRFDEYIPAAILIQFSHCYPLETKEEYEAILCNHSFRKRNEVVKEMKAGGNKQRPKFTGKNVSVEEMYDVFRKVSVKLFANKRYNDLQNLSLAALTSSLFRKNPQIAKDVEFQALLTCYFNKNYKYAYGLVKELVLKHMNSAKAWNFFCLIVTLGHEIRHNRFCLRLMMKHQDHLALGYLNGHNAMISGSYKHALGEYMCILKERPHDSYISFCVGITFIHMACQKFATNRHLLIIQGFAFLNQYLKLKGECQETFYNLGRALHQLGMKGTAVQFYKKALCAPMVAEGLDKEVFDLSREIAYNLALIYQSSGAMDLAYIYMRKYIVI